MRLTWDWARPMECDRDLNAREAGGDLAEGQRVWALGSGVHDCTD